MFKWLRTVKNKYNKDFEFGKNLNNQISLNSMLNASNLSNKEKFNNILSCAKQILDNSPNTCNDEHPIFDFIRIICRGLQSDYMKYSIYYNCVGGSHNVPMINDGYSISDVFSARSFNHFKKEVKCKKILNLSKDLIFPSVWNKDRLLNAIKNIGEHKTLGKWKQDCNNHFAEVWLPVGLTWVNGGNHSIAIGIIQGGYLKPENYYDISEAYKHIKCDGEYFIKTTEYSETQHPVKNVELAAVFEIGRLLLEKNISFAEYTHLENLNYLKKNNSNNLHLKLLTGDRCQYIGNDSATSFIKEKVYYIIERTSTHVRISNHDIVMGIYYNLDESSIDYFYEHWKILDESKINSRPPIDFEKQKKECEHSFYYRDLNNNIK